MSFRSVVTSNTKPLSASENRVLNVLLGQEVDDSTAADVAARANTHESTVVRLAQKLGYRGYPDLRHDLKRDGEVHSTSGTVMRGATGHGVVEFIDDETRALARVPQFLSQAELDAAARTLHGSNSIFLFSNSDDRPTLDLMARRLRRLGKMVIVLSSSPKDLAERFASFDHSSTVVGFALREAPRQLPTLLAEARRRGGKSILISDVPGYNFRPTPDHLLAANRGDDSEYRTQIVPIAICYALQLAVFHLDAAQYGGVRDGIDDLTRLFGGMDEIPLRS
ncbi:MAG: hypothetical protein JWQ43_364 [Glaciihabitans sp.]|nr:hypothetical protein [Glaciihabitans sp.]